jgi:hypothetical protein
MSPDQHLGVVALAYCAACDAPGHAANAEGGREGLTDATWQDRKPGMVHRLAAGQSERDPPFLGHQIRPAPERPKMINDLRILQIAARKVDKYIKGFKVGGASRSLRGACGFSPICCLHLRAPREPSEPRSREI